jgi:hypothetical protein
MERILVFCARDWLHPKAGWVEHYVREVFSRIAALGNHVVWVSHSFRFLASRTRRPPEMEMRDKIQIARVGARMLYRMMTGMFLSRLGSRTNPATRFDVVIDCVTAYPLPLAEHTDTPIIPLVFDLNTKVRAKADPPGPIIAASEKARRLLLVAGMAPDFVVRAPYGVDLAQYGSGGVKAQTPVVAVAGKVSGCFATALSRLEKQGHSLAVEHAAVGGKWGGLPKVPATLDNDAAARCAIYQRSWLGYCGTGAEQEALAMAACGLPVVCPATEVTEEYVQDGRTGLLYRPGKAHELADRFRQLVGDAALRTRLAVEARAHAETRSWDKTAGLVLATIENLPRPTRDTLKGARASLVRK